MRYGIYEITKGPSTMFVGARDQCLARHPGISESELLGRGVVLAELWVAIEHLRLDLPRLVDPACEQVKDLHFALTGKRVEAAAALREWLFGPALDRPDLDGVLALIAHQQGALSTALLGFLLVPQEEVATA